MQWRSMSHNKAFLRGFWKSEGARGGFYQVFHDTTEQCPYLRRSDEDLKAAKLAPFCLFMPDESAHFATQVFLCKRRFATQAEAQRAAFMHKHEGSENLALYKRLDIGLEAYC